MRCIAFLLVACLPLFGQSLADRMLAQLAAIQWSAPYSAKPNCQSWTSYQLAIWAPDQWSFHCAETSGGIIEESFFYALDGALEPMRLRVDLRPQDKSSELETTLRERLTRLYGTPQAGPELMEIGFRKLRYGEPVVGEHWHAGHLHYFLHHNQSNQMPMGMRHGDELIVFDDRLYSEREKDDFIHRVDGLIYTPPENDAIAKRLEQEAGGAYSRVLASQWKTQPERQALAEEAWHETGDLLTRAGRANRAQKALLLMAADPVVVKLSVLLAGPAEINQDPAATGIRRRLASFGVKLGGPTHDGGLAYENDLLRRVWREFPDTEGGEMAFVRLQQRGWYTGTGPGCPANPDLFHEVIEQGEAFLAARSQTHYREEIVFTLAVAYESWWSIAHAPADDAIVSAPPYPRKLANRKDSGRARTQAIKYYREVVQLAPESPEAASALRRLPRLELNLDTGQRRFFCSFC